MKPQTQAPTTPGMKDQAAPRPQVTAPDVHEEAVRRMAYTLYEARGCIGGHELEDWLRAEALVAQASVGSASTVPEGADLPPAGAAAKPKRAAAKKSAGVAAKTPAAAKKSAGTATKAAGAATKRAAGKTGST